MEKAQAVRVVKTIGMWIPAILLVLVFARQGWAKFDNASGWAVAFRQWGYPDWFRVTIGIMELTAVVLLLLGRTAAFGAILIILVMLGAEATHLIFDHGQHMTSEVVPLVLATIVLIVRRRQVSNFVARVRRTSAAA
ncbi:MAG TPA: DoxX family protein [Gemmatimonadales bacterium]|nr:DoxX family protein [Gemmatimonadales bacterium]